MKRIVAAGAVLVLVALAAAALLVSSLTRRGFSVHDEPTAMEAMVARRMRAWAVPRDLRNEKNPVPLTPAVLAEARAHFADHCATCHGNDGRGRTAIGQRLYPPAPDMTLAETQQLSDGALFAVIENGIRLTGMPGWGDGTAGSAYGTWTLVHFIRRLPSLTPQEIREMERLNPASRAALEREIRESVSASGGGDTDGPAPHAATPHEH